MSDQPNVFDVISRDLAALPRAPAHHGLTSRSVTARAREAVTPAIWSGLPTATRRRIRRMVEHWDLIDEVEGERRRLAVIAATYPRSTASDPAFMPVRPYAPFGGPT